MIFFFADRGFEIPYQSLSRDTGNITKLFADLLLGFQVENEVSGFVN
jgi:hypothetical protein